MSYKNVLGMMSKLYSSCTFILCQSELVWVKLTLILSHKTLRFEWQRIFFKFKDVTSKGNNRKMRYFVQKSTFSKFIGDHE